MSIDELKAQRQDVLRQFKQGILKSWVAVKELDRLDELIQAAERLDRKQKRKTK